MAGSLGTLLPSLGFLDPIVQDNTLVREFRDALFPNQLFRMDATPERWEANAGETKIYTRASLLPVVITPITPGTDPTPENILFEQWSVVAAQVTATVDTHMPSSRTALASLFARNAKTLGLQAGQSLNRISRDKLFCAYTGGDTITDNAATSVSVVVASINGFTTTVPSTSGGLPVAVSAGNPLTVQISGVSGTSLVIAASPTDTTNPFGPGTLTLAASATFLAGARVIAQNAPRIIRVGGASTIDGLTALSALTLKEIRTAVASMERNRVPRHVDGYYHVHLDPAAVSQIFNDNEFQRLNQGVPDNYRYGEFVIGRLLGCLFFSNNEAPNIFNSAPEGTALTSSRPASTTGTALSSPEYFAEVVNATGIGIIRTIITGGGSIMESWIDENVEYLSEAGITGKVGEFTIVNNSLIVNTDRIRYIIRAPLDRLQQNVSQSWSWSGDFGIPTDELGGITGGRFKRAVTIESGSDDTN